MRRLGLLVAVALMMGATTSFAQSGKEANQTSFERLSKYLRLTEAQAPEVAEINAYFENQYDDDEDFAPLLSEDDVAEIYSESDASDTDDQATENTISDSSEADEVNIDGTESEAEDTYGTVSEENDTDSTESDLDDIEVNLE